MFQACLGDVLGMAWDALGMFWVRSGHVLGMFLACIGDLLGMFQGPCKLRITQSNYLATRNSQPARRHSLVSLSC